MKHQNEKQISLFDRCADDSEDCRESTEHENCGLVDYSFSERLADKEDAESREIYESILSLVKDRYA